MFERIIKSFDLKDAGSVILLHGNLKEEFFLTSSKIDEYKNSKKSNFNFLFWNYGIENKKDVFFYSKHNNAYCIDKNAFEFLWTRIKKSGSVSRPTNNPEETVEYKKRSIALSIWTEINQNDFISSINNVSNLFKVSQGVTDNAFASFVKDLSTLLDDQTFKDTFDIFSKQKVGS